MEQLPPKLHLHLQIQHIATVATVPPPKMIAAIPTPPEAINATAKAVLPATQAH